ncbi:MAG: AmmeMemoRadiSam system radical SAM enzyme, partial [Rubripirellula sp.]
MSPSRLPVVPLEATQFDDAGEAIGRWWSEDSNDRVLCELCPRACRLKEGDRGFCFVRVNRGGKIVLDTYGRSTGFCIDPIEKKPLNHFLPGTPVLSFGTAGCNLGCKFCQNWDISKSREVSRLSDLATPLDIALEAKRTGCRSVAFTYNDPVIWAEYALDTAAACRQIGLKAIAVTAGYLTDVSRQDFFAGMDAANIDLKAFTEDFYFKLTGAHLQPVLDTIRYACRETDCWVELTNLVIPNANDNFDELRRMVDWILEAVGSDVPVHFTAFHPDFRMSDVPRTSHETLVMAYDLARQAGLNFVYVGNVNDVARQSTYCPSCHQLLIERDWHQLGRYALHGNRCVHCEHELPGLFEPTPGNWGRQRQPLQIPQQSTLADVVQLIHPQPDSNVTENSQSQERILDPRTHSAKLNMKSSEMMSPALSDNDLQSIHRVACEYVASVIRPPLIDAGQQLGELATRPVSGMYVTLKRGETLRGCCGMQGPAIPLSSALADAATRTALHDPRMAPVAAAELPHLTLSVSVIGPPRPIEASGDDRIGAVHVGEHGLRIRLGNQVGLLLPVVARERDWDARQFLDAVCNKAGLPPGSWRRQDALVEVFDGIDYSAPFAVATDAGLSEAPLVDEDTLQRLCRWIKGNLTALSMGATPFYYATAIEDKTVAGIVLKVKPPNADASSGWMQLSVREGVPMQATLYKLTQTAVDELRTQAGEGEWQVELGVLSQTIHHGVDTDFQVQEVDAARRAIIAMDEKRWSITFDQASDVEALVSRALDAQPFRAGGTMIYSAVCDSTTPNFAISAGPQAQPDIEVRRPAVAGSFYPADDLGRETMVDGILQELESQDTETLDRKPVAAMMVPHAGLSYSGTIAADAWRRVELPSRVLIISPKHTRDGVDWAVAPHSAWQLSDAVAMPGDVELAQHIAQNV